MDEPTLAALDRDLKPLNSGDLVRFIMAGFFLPREQENYGRIIAIDRWGGIRIKTSSPYRHFTSIKTIADYSEEIYFVHHRYDSALKARVYQMPFKGHELFVAKIDEDDAPVPEYLTRIP